jgi:hypothetical protein
MAVPSIITGSRSTFSEPTMNRPDDWQHDHEVGGQTTRDTTRVDDVRISALSPQI